MKRFLFLTVFVGLGAISMAQFNVGVKAGYNSSLTLNTIGNVSDGSYNLENVKSEIWNNFQAGVFGRVFLQKFYVQPEVLYSIQKKEYELMDVMIDGTATDVETYMTVSNVEVPVFVGYKVLDMKVANFRVFAGPKFVLDTGSSLDYQNITSEQVTKAGLMEDFKKSRIDLEAGIGADVFMFALDARLNLVKDVGGKVFSVNDISNIHAPTSRFVISLSWKLF